MAPAPRMLLPAAPAPPLSTPRRTPHLKPLHRHANPLATSSFGIPDTALGRVLSRKHVMVAMAYSTTPEQFFRRFRASSRSSSRPSPARPCPSSSPTTGAVRRRRGSRLEELLLEAEGRRPCPCSESSSRPDLHRRCSGKEEEAAGGAGDPASPAGKEEEAADARICAERSADLRPLLSRRPGQPLVGRRSCVRRRRGHDKR